MFFKKKSNVIKTKEEYLKFSGKLRYRHVVFRKDVHDELFIDMLKGALENCIESNNGDILKDYIEKDIQRRVDFLKSLKEY